MSATTMSGESKVMSLRLGVDLADQISAVARTDEMPITETIREAMRQYIEVRCADPEFQERRKKRMAHELRVLKDLGGRA
jgi:predicted transcriptional regulator